MRNEVILVVGGTGMLGAPVARQLRASGYGVRIFTHRQEKAREMFSGEEYEIATGDVEDAGSLESALRGCGGMHINLLDMADLELEQRGVEKAARAAAQAGLRRITYLSGATVSEENGWFAGTRAKLRAEAAIRACGVPFTIFRAASFMEGLPQFVRGESASLIGSQPHPWHWVAAADYARMVSNAYSGELENQTAYVLGPEAMTTREALTTYCRIARPGVAIRTMPMWMARIVASAFRVKDLASALPYLRYFETVRESVPPAGTEVRTGATTLEQWCRQQAESLRHQIT